MMYRFLLLLALFGAVLSGCGADWFPDNRVSVDSFSFTPATGVATGSTQTSNAVTVSLTLGDSAPISVSNGSYSINSETNFVTAAGTVNSGDVVRVRHTASSTAGQTVSTTLTIGDKSATFTSTTAASTSTATVAAFSFDPAVKFSVTPGSSQVSNIITVSITGGTTAPISVTGGEFVKNGTASTAAGTVSNGDQVVVRHTAADGTTATAVNTTLTIGDKSATFSTTTARVLEQTVTVTAAAGSDVRGEVALRLAPGSYDLVFVSTSSAQGAYTLSATEAAAGEYTNIDQLAVPFVDQQKVFFSDIAPAAGQTASTVLTIDGVRITFQVTGT